MGDAVKVTLLPEHIVVALAETDMAGVTEGFTIIVTALEVAVVGDAQGAVDVMTQVITSPFANAAFIYVLLLVPAFPPFSFH